MARWNLVEADFQRFYRIDLRHEARTAGCRRLFALLVGLPEDAAVWREEMGGWSRQDELAAVAVEATDFWGRVLAQMWGAKDHELPDPVRIEHPDRVREAPAPKGNVVTDPREIAAWFAKGG